MYGGKQYMPVDCTNDLDMVLANIRQPKVRIDRACFMKTPEEKSAVKSERNRYSPKGSKPVMKVLDNEIKGNLIIYLKNLKKEKHFKTTVSVECYESYVPHIIASYEGVLKAFFNNKKVK